MVACLKGVPTTESSTSTHLRNGSHLAAVTPTNYVLELSPDGDGGKTSAAEARQRPQAAAASSGGGLKRKRRSAKQQQQVALAAANSQGTLNL